jgi:hypothetical protein
MKTKKVKAKGKIRHSANVPVSGSLRFSDNELLNIAWAAKFNYDKKIKEEYSKEKKRSHKQWLKIILQLCKQAKAQ